MASSGNFATWNKLSGTLASATGNESLYEHGNTSFRGNNGGGNNCMSVSSLHMTSGKWYIEVYLDGAPAGGWPGIGIIKSDNITEAQNVGNMQNKNYTSFVTATNGNKVAFDSTSGASFGSAYSSGDIYNIAVDIDAGKIWWGKNNTWFASGDPAAGNNAGDTFTAGTEMALFVTVYNGASKCVINAGQDDTFAGNVTAAGNADGNGFGVFKYSPPTGFLALCSGNLPISDDIDPAQTDDDYPAKNFNAVAYTGNQTDDRAVTCGFKPDLVWLKQRASFSNPGILTDSSRGATKRIESYAAIAEATDSDGLKSFTSDGFTLGTNDKYNWTSDHTYVAWCWKANGGVTSSNTDGSITSTVQANTKGGFSIMTYTGTGSNATIGHGLSAKPDFILTKRRSSEQTWGVYHSALGATKYLALNSNAAAGTDSAFWNDTEPTTSVISLGTEGRVNQNSGTYVAYAWHNVEGYSRFGSYEGNADDDGPFVYTGFRPRMLWIKEADSADDWVVYDTARDPFNRGSSRVVRFESNVVEFDGATRAIDILSNGFKIRTSNNTINQSSTFVWGCWGDVPFKYNNAF